MQRLGRNKGGYFGEQIDIHSVLRELEIPAQQYGWTSDVFYQIEGLKWLALRRPPLEVSGAISRVYISTGIHGDEPAGPLAAARLVRENRWPAGMEVSILACLNPLGFMLNKRENPEGIDLNRDYLHLKSAEIRAHVEWLKGQGRFDLCLCLHEDWESEGFYLYELNPDQQPAVAEAIIKGVEKTCPIDLSPMIEGRPAVGGIIRPDLDPKLRTQWPESYWLITNKTRLSYTLEAPSDFSLSTRVDALVAGVNAALEALPKKT